MTTQMPGGFGAALRRRREELGLSLDELAAGTRIRKTYLQALEEENLQLLPGGAYAVGFLRIYARQLGLAVEPLVAAMHGDGERDAEGNTLPQDSERRRLIRQQRSGRKGARLLLLLLLLLATAAAAYLALSVGEQAEPRRSPPMQPPPQVALPPATEPSPSPAAPPASSVGTPLRGASGTVAPAEVQGVDFPVLPRLGAVVRMLPTAAGLMKVSLDGQETRDYQLQPDQALHWKVTESLAVELSAPGLVRLWVEQQELPLAEASVFTLVKAPLQEARP